MEYPIRVSKTNLARNVRKVIRNVQRGQTTIVENHGQPEAAILDIMDYHLLLAVANAHTNPISLEEPVPDLLDQEVKPIEDDQERFNKVTGYYLAEHISLSRAAELLGLPRIDLQYRFERLGISLRLGPASEEELRQEIDTVESWIMDQK